MDSEHSDDDCYICYDIMSDPSKVPCGHYMCLNCLENVLNFKRSCPMCRAEVPASFKPQVDKDRQKKIQEKHKATASAYLKQLKLQKVYCDTLTMNYGNTHKLVNSNTDNIHAWSTFVKLADNKLDVSYFITKVVFTIHPTFRNSIIEVAEAPFRLARIGWGTFPVNIVIHWKQWLKKSPTKLIHDLSFDGSGNSMTETVKFSKSIFENNNKEEDEDEEDEEEEEEEEDDDATSESSDSCLPVPKSLDVCYGNKHVLVDNQSQNKHKWTAFVKFSDNSLDTSEYIQKVVFKLHPTFPNPEREVKKAPFQIESAGWGTFKMIIVVYWRDWLGKKPSTLYHELSFSGDGSSNTKTLYFK